MDAGRGTYVAFAASPGGIAEDNPRNRNSIFTAALLKALK